jgi:hypothetical protein
MPADEPFAKNLVLTLRGSTGAPRQGSRAKPARQAKTLPPGASAALTLRAIHRRCRRLLIDRLASSGQRPAKVIGIEGKKPTSFLLRILLRSNFGHSGCIRFGQLIANMV